MISAPDVVAFTKEDEYEEEVYSEPALPEEYSLPLYPFANHGANPWSKLLGAKFTRDFILISEFSEQVGPQPLLTIPDDAKVSGTFDLNYFSLRIMSVDYQASFVGHPPGCPYPKLNFVEDSKVVLGDSKEGAFAYVHHLSLYHLETRGFVHPFCNTLMWWLLVGGCASVLQLPPTVLSRPSATSSHQPLPKAAMHPRTATYHLQLQLLMTNKTRTKLVQLPSISKGHEASSHGRQTPPMTTATPLCGNHWRWQEAT